MKSRTEPGCREPGLPGANVRVLLLDRKQEILAVFTFVDGRIVQDDAEPPPVLLVRLKGELDALLLFLRGEVGFADLSGKLDLVDGDVLGLMVLTGVVGATELQGAISTH